MAGSNLIFYQSDIKNFDRPSYTLSSVGTFLEMVCGHTSVSRGFRMLPEDFNSSVMSSFSQNVMPTALRPFVFFFLDLFPTYLDLYNFHCYDVFV